MAVLAGFLCTLGIPNSLFHQPAWLFFMPIIGSALYYFVALSSFVAPFSINKRDLFFLPLAFTLGTFIIGFNWIATAMGNFTTMPYLPMAIISIFFNLALVFQYVLFPVLVYFWHKSNRPLIIKMRNSKIYNHSRPAWHALVIVLLENNLTTYFTFHAGLSWSYLSPYLGLAPVVGAVGFSFVSNLLAFALAEWAQNKFYGKASPRFEIVFVAGFILLNLIIPLNSSHEEKKSTMIRLVQGNVSKPVEPDLDLNLCMKTDGAVETYKELSFMPGPYPKLDLIIWPEGMYPTALSSHQLMVENFPVPEMLDIMITTTKTSFLVGANDFTYKNGVPKKSAGESGYENIGNYNAAFLFGRDKKIKAVYHKNRLMPIGETLPFDFLYPIVALYARHASKATPGKGTALFELDNGTKFATVICFESLFFHLIRNHLNALPENVHFLVNMANDSWFGNTMQPWQNFFALRWPALENGVPFIRVATTGITGIIESDGTYGPRLPFNEKKAIDIVVQTPIIAKTTIYRFLGQGATFLLFAIYIGCSAILRRYLRRRYFHNNADILHCLFKLGDEIAQYCQ
ncbi:MAG: apolipoprotein N-acyltransferase [Bdellovibrio sp.]|nr:apolipoprotein N-acyltransferase [Bdellovibrio sp.]